MKKLVLTTLAALLLSAPGLYAAEIDKNALPPPKRTSLGLYLTAADAFARGEAARDKLKFADAENAFRESAKSYLKEHPELSVEIDNLIRTKAGLRPQQAPVKEAEEETAVEAAPAD